MEDRALKLVEPPTTPRAERDTVSTEVSLDALFRDHYQDVFLAAYRVCGNAEDAEDVLQSVFLRLLKRTENEQSLANDEVGPNDLNLGDKPASYICRAAINASLDVLRSKRRKPTTELDHEHVEETSHAAKAESQIQSEQQRRYLRQALSQVNERGAEMFVLRHFEEYSNNEIAELFETTSSTVAVTLHRTRERLQELLREFGGETP